MSTLFNIIGEATEIAQLYAELVADETRTDEEQAGILLAWFGENKAAFENKADAYIAVIRDYMAMESAAKDEAKRLTDRAKSHSRHVERLKDTLKDAMIALGLDKTKTALNTITLAKSGSISYDVDPDSVPECYTRTKTEIDRTAIQTALKAGIEIAGVIVKPSTPSLRIK